MISHYAVCWYTTSIWSLNNKIEKAGEEKGRVLCLPWYLFRNWLGISLLWVGGEQLLLHCLFFSHLLNCLHLHLWLFSLLVFLFSSYPSGEERMSQQQRGCLAAGQHQATIQAYMEYICSKTLIYNLHLASTDYVSKLTNQMDRAAVILHIQTLWLFGMLSGDKLTFSLDRNKDIRKILAKSNGRKLKKKKPTN